MIISDHFSESDGPVTLQGALQEYVAHTSATPRSSVIQVKGGAGGLGGGLGSGPTGSTVRAEDGSPGKDGDIYIFNPLNNTSVNFIGYLP